MIFKHQQQESMRVVPHPRTLRKARENVKQMVNSGVSLRRIRSYLHHFVIWWSKIVETWRYEKLLEWFVCTCFEIEPAAIAAGLLQKLGVTLSNTYSVLYAGDVA